MLLIYLKTHVWFIGMKIMHSHVNELMMKMYEAIIYKNIMFTFLYTYLLDGESNKCFVYKRQPLFTY